MHRISGWPDIWPNIRPFFDIRYPVGYRISLAGYPAFFDVRYPAGYRISLARYPAGYQASRILKKAGYPAK